MEQVVDKRNIGREEWLNYRRSGIGGSDAGAVLELNPYVSRLCIYFDKIGEYITKRGDTSDAVYWGNRLESIIAEEFTKQSGFEAEPCNYMLRSSEYPFMIADIDRLIVDNEEGLEIKTAGAFNKSEWEGGEIPEMYYAQIQHYMAVTGFEGWWIAVLIGGNHFQYKYIERDDEYIKELIEIESEFWFKYVQPKVMPDIDGSSATSNFIKWKFYKTIPKSSISLNGDADNIINSYFEYLELENKYNELKEQCSNKLKFMLGEHERGSTDEYIVNWNNINSSRFDSQLFKKVYPELFKEYSKDSSYRRFSIKSI